MLWEVWGWFLDKWGIGYDQAFFQINNTHTSYHRSPLPNIYEQLRILPVDSYRSLVTQVGGVSPILQMKEPRLSSRKFKKMCWRSDSSETWTPVSGILLPKAIFSVPAAATYCTSTPGTGLRRLSAVILASKWSWQSEVFMRTLHWLLGTLASFTPGTIQVNATSSLWSPDGFPV